MRREINKIIIHCTNTDVDYDIEEIERWHLKRGFDSVGYHFLVKRNGIQIGRPIEIQGAHTYGENGDSIGIALTGKNHFEKKQFELTAKLIDSLFPGLPVEPHSKYNPQKTCPNFEISQICQFLAEARAREFAT